MFRDQRFRDRQLNTDEEYSLDKILYGMPTCVKLFLSHDLKVSYVNEPAEQAYRQVDRQMVKHWYY